MASSAYETATRSLRKAAPAIQLLARAGYAAKGIVYVVMGFLAARAAIGAGGTTTDTKGAVRIIGDGPFGTIALLVMGIGLLGYMTWRLVAAVTDAERAGDDATSLLVRTGQAARGLAYGALGIFALRELTASPDSGGDAAKHWTARVLDMPFGEALVIAAGLGVIGYAGYQLYRATSRKLLKHLDLASAGPTQASWIERLGRFGVGARGVVFAMIGVFVLRAGRERDAGEAGGVAQSLSSLASAPYGGVVLGTVALGLVAYGTYQIATARYRHIRVT